MFITFLVATNFILVSGSLNDKVRQTPAHIYNTKGTSAEIKCSHSIDSYNQILWYKKLHDGQLQFLGYIFGNTGYPESGAKVKMTGSAYKGQTTILTIEEPSSAVYYCAASLTVMKGPMPQYTNLNYRFDTCKVPEEKSQSSCGSFV